ncbi:MAG: glycoside hydrolase family 15 protein, partial [Myxococcaceae bacterium]|nr:glycoside hydrolase family 15 protein [Myxococcaceae bacterium]
SALFRLGLAEEAEAFVSWMLHATRLTLPELRVLYDVYGRPPERETLLEHLEGYEGSRPVRIRNAASTQLQLDCYGEVIEAATQLVRRGGHLDGQARHLLRSLGTYVCEHWREPDAGIWESRGPLRHHTYSRVLCWVALDRLLELHALGALPSLPRARLEEERRLLREEVETRCWSEELQSYVEWRDGHTLDACLLLLSWYGYARPDEERQRATWRCIVGRLGTPGRLLYRHERSRDEGEGAFAPCSFWEAEYLARGGGSLAQATESFEWALRYANDVGLFGEEVDVRTGQALGNFPQAFTHVGVINTALALEERARRERGASPEHASWVHASESPEVRG